MIIVVIIATLAGASVVISRNINSALAIRIGLFQGAFFNYIVGLLFSCVVLLFSSSYMNMPFKALKGIPLWAYLGGLVGVLVVVASNLVTPHISAFYQTLLVFLGQIFTGILIDYFILNSISKGKIIGGTLVVFGLICNLIIDKQDVEKVQENNLQVE